MEKYRVKQLTQKQHKVRLRELLKAGHSVTIVTLPNGTKVVLKSKKGGVCYGGHCVKRVRLSKRRRR